MILGRRVRVKISNSKKNKIKKKKLFDFTPYLNQTAFETIKLAIFMFSVNQPLFTAKIKT